MDVPTIGIPNVVLAMPWTHAGSYTATTPAGIALTNGIWSGALRLPAGTHGTARLQADSGIGISGESGWLTIQRQPALTVTPGEGLLKAGEANAGLAGCATIAIPESRTNSLTVRLRVSDTNEFQVPAFVVISAGATEVPVAVTNYDDLLPDGAAVVTLTAEAPGYESGSAQLLNVDNEPGELLVNVPGPLQEDSGFKDVAGSVWLPAPARHDVLVTLSAEPPLEVPLSVLIRQGNLSASFPVRVGADAVVNPKPWRVEVRAQTAGWPEAVTAVTLEDDYDDRFSLLLPSAVLEGTTGQGWIQVNVAREKDTRFTVTSNNPRLVAPAEVTLAAGVLTVGFPLAAPDNTVADGSFWGIRVCAETAGQFTGCEQIEVVDDEVNITRLMLQRPPRVVFSGQPFAWRATLANPSEQPQYTNTTGRLELLASASVGRFAADPNPLQFSQGTWSNSLTLLGEGLQLQFRAEAAGFEGRSAPFDLLPGYELALTVSDAAYDPGTGLLLVAEPAKTNEPALLTEYYPRTGARGRSLNLPRPVQRIALSDDGRVAWLASTLSTLQKINLAAWELAGEYPVQSGSTNGIVQELLVLPGGSGRVLALMNTNRLAWQSRWQIAVFQDGVAAAVTNRISVPGGGPSGILLRGRTPGEVFCQSSGFLSRLAVEGNAVKVDKTANIRTSSGHKPNLTLLNNRLYRGTGEVYSADTLTVVDTFPVMVSTTLGIPCPERNIALFVSVNGTFALQAHDLETHEALASHGLPESLYESQSLFRWGSRGVAMFQPNGSTLVVLESPLLSPGMPDLVLTSTGPDAVTLPGYDNAPFFVTREFSITNRGEVHAPGVELRLASGATYSLGTLAPGEGGTVVLTNVASFPELLRYDASAASVLRDANPGNNILSVATRVRRKATLSTRELTLGMTHLVASPGGERLYTAVARSAGELQDGVAIINPATGTVEAMLPVGNDPRQLAVSGDGTQLYALLGTNTLVRWNLGSRTQNLALTLEQDAIVDFTPLPDSGSAFVLASPERVAVYDDLVPRPQAHTAYNERRYIGFAGGALWMAEPGQLTPFDIGPAGLQPRSTAPFTFSLLSNWYRFNSDGRRLFFSGAVFDTETAERHDLFMGDQVTPDLAHASLFSVMGKEVRRYSADTYELRGSHLVVQAGDWYLQDLVRWGEGGLAARSGAQLLIVDSPLVPSPLEADVAVEVVAPPVPLPYETMEWTVILTNRSQVTAPRTSMQLEAGPLRDLVVEGPPTALSWSLLIYDAGELPGHSSAVFKLRGWSFPAAVTVSARVLTAAADPNPANNQASASVTVSEPVADLSILSISLPARVSEGEIFGVTAVFTNRGPDVAPNTLLGLHGAAGLQFLGVQNSGHGTNEYGVLLGSVDAGDSRTVGLLYKAVAPGLAPVVTSANGSVSDGDWHNSWGSGWVYVAPADPGKSIIEMSSQGSLMAWDASRQQVLAAFPDKSWDLFVLNPGTLEPVSRMRLPGLPQFIVTCNNGRHAWVSLSDASAVRVDLDAMSIDQQFSYGEAAPVWAVATPPGKSNLLVVATDPGWLGNNRLILFDNGVKRPGEYGPLGWAGGGVSLLFTPEGRLFLGASQMLRELRLTATGFEEVRNLDGAAQYDNVSLTRAAGRLFYKLGRWVDPETGTFDDGLFPAYPLAADDQTSLLYTASGSRILWGGAPMQIRCLDAASLASRWQAVLELPSSDVGAILPMGTNGCVLVGSSTWLVRPQLFDAPAADLALSVSNAPTTAEIGIPLEVRVSVTNRSVWTAPNASVLVQLGPGLTFTDLPQGEAGKLSLGDLNGVTNFSVWALPTAAGPTTLRLQATSNLPDPAPDGGRADIPITVLPPPVLQLDNTTLPEGSSYRPSSLTARLSRPASTNLSVTFAVTPLAAGPDDFRVLSGSFDFAPGETSAWAYIIEGNGVPEFDKTARLTLSSTNVSLAASNVVLTIANDDWPTLSVTNVSLAEGNSGFTNASYKFVLSQKAPFPVSVQFEVVPATATPGLDYLPRLGWIQFPANTDSQTVPVPVLGDTAFELTETASLVLFSAANADLGSASAPLTIRNDDAPRAPSLHMTPASPGLFRFEFVTEAGATYQLQSRTNLTTDPWKNLGTAVSGTGNVESSSQATPAGSTFYRLKAWANLP